MFSILSPQHEPSVYPIPAASAFGVLLPISVHLYKYPWSLLFFFILIPLAFRRIAMRSGRHFEAKFVCLR